MIIFDDVTGENRQKDNVNRQQIHYYPYWILIIDASESGKTNALLYSINCQPDIDKIY